MTIVETRDLSIKIGKRTLVTGLNWQLRQGEFWCVLGRNGAGKSLLLHTLSGLIAPSKGSIMIGHRAIDDMPPVELARLRGLMPQHLVDSFSCTVGDAVAIARTPWRVGGAWDSDEITLVSDALARVGMLDRIADDITRLSGGERQRVAFAAMLVQDPALMLFDEPTSHQDVAQQLLLMRLMRASAQQHAVVASCHDINLVARFATHVLLLGEDFHQAGAVAEVLTADALMRTFGCEFVRSGEQFIAA